jgi:large subunit ribosomal protein L6
LLILNNKKMSNIGKRLIQIPENVKIYINKKDSIIIFEGPLGKQDLKIPHELEISLIEDSLLNSKFLKIVNAQITTIKEKITSEKIKTNNNLWGTFRSIVVNRIIGVSQGFQITLKIVGVGYRASLESLENSNDNYKEKLILKLGFSHLIDLNIPKNISVKCIKPTRILLRSNHLEELMQYAALIRSFKRPEPYKGKGILYKGEKIRKKEGKKK